ncbi:MAG: hypothetical protein ABMA26_16940 [Limisphaerales bacterium]
MKHSDLVDLLKGLERAWNTYGSVTPGSTPPLPPLAGAWVRPSNNIQYFACSDDRGNPDLDLPVVVDVGINYTQAKEWVPGYDIVDKDLNNIDAEKRCIAHCNQERDAWEKTCLCSTALTNPLLLNLSANPPVREFHLVATNFSPWITTHSWWSVIAGSFSPAIAADLLAHPPHSLRSKDPFGHLTALHEKLQKVDASAVWIGHGLEAVAAHFRLWTGRMNIQNWMITGNLAMLHLTPPTVRPGAGPNGEDLVKFGKPRKQGITKMDLLEKPVDE